MKWYLNLKISTKLIIGFLVTALICALLGVFSIVNTNNLEKNNVALYEQNTVPISLVGQMQVNFLKMRLAVRGITVTKGAERNTYIDQIKTLQSDLTQEVSDFEKYVDKPEEKKIFGEFKALLEKYGTSVEKVSNFVIANQIEQANVLIDQETKVIGLQVNDALQKVSDENIKEAKLRSDNNNATANRNINIMIIILVIAVVASIGLGLYISNVISKPLRKMLEAASGLSEGNLNVNIDIDTKDEIGNLGKAFEKIVLALEGLVADTNLLTQAAIEGKLNTRADATKHKGDYKKIVEGVNNTLDEVIGPLNVAAEYVDRISKGDIPPKITDNYKGDFNEIKNNVNLLIDSTNEVANVSKSIAEGNLNTSIQIRSENDILMQSLTRMIGSLKGVSKEIQELTSYALDGDMTKRGDASQYQGTYREMVEGINALIDSVANPVNDLMKVLKRMSVNDYTVQMKSGYKGIWSDLKADSDEVQARVSNAIRIIENISRGILSDLPDMQAVQRRSEHDKLVPSLLHALESIQSLVNEANMLANAAVEGKLSTRSNADKFQGSFKEIIQGVNKTLDAVLQPINEAAECLSEMAKGNLDVHVTGDYMGDHAMIKDALNTTLEAINEILSQVNVSVDQVAAGSRQVAESSQGLSQGATESASAVEEITSSMHEMASQTNLNAENAGQANQLAISARDNAEKGNEMMGQMVKAMMDINESASNISKIIKVIDEIAFQTNLLALNAAVEAARAGKHGKGFTVVAEEVRNLAQRSAKAAKETAEMIEGSIKKTELGTKIAEGTSKSLEEIVAGATKVTDLISEIASASKEQAQGIGQINQGLSQVDQITQANTASAEEMASAGEELSGQALQLKGMLGKFKIQQHNHVPAYSQAAATQYIPEQTYNNKTKANVPWGNVASVAISKKNGGVRPEDVISLDDKDFGKF